MFTLSKYFTPIMCKYIAQVIDFLYIMSLFYIICHIYYVIIDNILCQHDLAQLTELLE